MPRGDIRVERVRVTRVGLAFIGVAIVVGVAATNTGNNALYLVESMLLALLVVSGVASRRNLRQLEVAVEPPGEVYAAQPFRLRLRLVNRDRWLPRRLLVVSGPEGSEPVLALSLARLGSWRGSLPCLIGRRGRLEIPWLRVASVYPLGLFYKAMRVRVGLEFLVYPEISPVVDRRRLLRGGGGDEPAGRRGPGHDLLALRPFRPGDDPRSIHWKRTARTGELIFMERESEEGRRLTIVFDNAVGELASEAERRSFERWVSEAASAAHHYLTQDFEVALVTRDERLQHGRGRAHRSRILEVLALVEARAEEPVPLVAPEERGGAAVRLGIESSHPAAV